jgi:hypothetical protein
LRRPARAVLAASLVLAGCSEPDAPASRESEPAGAPNARVETARELAQDEERPRHASDGGGHAWLEPIDGRPRVARVGEPSRFAIVYEAGPLGIAVGGGIQLQVPPYWGWSTPQAGDPEAPGYTEVRSLADGLAFETETRGEGLFVLSVAGRAMAAGERVRIDYGAGAAGAMPDRFAERRSRFAIGVDGDGDGVRAWLPDPPAVDVLPGPAAQLRVSLPALARPGEPVRLVVAALDAEGSAGVDLRGTVTLALPPELAGPGEVALGAGARAVVELVARGAGIARVAARGPGELAAESNPLVVSRSAPRILWADLHGHTQLSDGTGTPKDYFDYARDVAGLDVAAITDHDHWGIPFLDRTPAHWEEIENAVRAAHAPGRFVSLVGYEWTNWVYGHRHVVGFDDALRIRGAVDPESDTPQELWALLRGQRVLTFAHHSAGDPVATDWSIPPDPVLEPVTEVASVHGSSEAADAPMPVRGAIAGNFVRDALARGYPLGFVGSGDSHDGHPGFAHVAGGTGGLAAIFAEERTREAVLAALRARRCYATNGPRIVLHARLDGAEMGARLPASAATKLVVRAAAESELLGVDVIDSRGGVQRVPAPDGAREVGFEAPVDSAEPGGWLYVRVLQRDGGAAWSSPFFFE